MPFARWYPLTLGNPGLSRSLLAVALRANTLTKEEVLRAMFRGRSGARISPDFPESPERSPLKTMSTNIESTEDADAKQGQPPPDNPPTVSPFYDAASATAVAADAAAPSSNVPAPAMSVAKAAPSTRPNLPPVDTSAPVAAAKEAGGEKKKAGQDEEEMGLVVDGLWLGSLNAALDGEALAAAGITHVVDLANTVQDERHKGQACFVVRAGDASCDWLEQRPSVVARLVVVIDDVEDAPLDEHFDAVNAFIAEARGADATAACHQQRHRQHHHHRRRRRRRRRRRQHQGQGQRHNNQHQHQ